MSEGQQNLSKGTARKLMKLVDETLWSTSAMLMMGAFLHLFLFISQQDKIALHGYDKVFKPGIFPTFLGYLALVIILHVLPVLLKRNFTYSPHSLIPAVPLCVHLLLFPMDPVSNTLGMVAAIYQILLLMQSNGYPSELAKFRTKFNLFTVSDKIVWLNPLSKKILLASTLGLLMIALYEMSHQIIPIMRLPMLFYCGLAILFSLACEFRLVKKMTLKQSWGRRTVQATASHSASRFGCFLIAAKWNILSMALLLLALCFVKARPYYIFAILLRQVLVQIWICLATSNKSFDLKNYIEFSGRILIGSFLLLILFGGAILSMPVCSSTNQSIGWLNAFFTATSAICVTGLAVLDTATKFSPTGQAVICVLIQLGGLGIMTISFFVAMTFSHKMGIVGNEGMLAMTGEDRYREAKRFLKAIVIGTFTTEFIGAVILSLWFYFAMNYRIAKAIGHGVFFAVSAFCNAGFSLYSDSLTQLSAYPLPMLTIACLVMAGGISFIVLLTLWDKMHNRNKQITWECHSRMVLYTTSILWIVGTAIFLLCEGDIFQDFTSIPGKLLHGFFHAVSTRSAGFNCVPLAELSHASKMFSIILMFIGVAPGSAGGGIKVTTLCIMFLQVKAWLTGSRDVIFSGRKIPQATIVQTGAVIAITAFFVSVGTFILSLVMQDKLLEDLLFEAVSATGTVGMSLDITPTLNQPGKLLVMLMMFVGRIGPLTFFFAFMPKASSFTRYVDTKIIIG